MPTRSNGHSTRSDDEEDPACAARDRGRGDRSGHHLDQRAGATFPFPIYSKWFSEYNKAHPSVQINYQSIGSGGGIKQITEKTVDFGASDAPMNSEELLKAPGIQHIPTVMGAVVIIHNAPGVQDLKLTPETVAGIFLGKITQWNDPAIAAQNKGRERLGGGPVYVSFDVDAIDPAFAPGTGTPVPGGMTSREAFHLLRALKGVKLAGMDLVEVCPALDHADITSHLGAHLLFEGLALLA